MRTKKPLLGIAGAALLLAACAPARVAYVKPGASRDTVAIDALDCNKAAVIARRDHLARSIDPHSTRARHRAAVLARLALHRCAVKRGYRRVQ